MASKWQRVLFLFSCISCSFFFAGSCISCSCLIVIGQIHTGWATKDCDVLITSPWLSLAGLCIDFWQKKKRVVGGIMLICPHLCWQQFPALVLLPRPLASGHLYDVSTSHVLPCIHLSLQSRLYMHCGSACAFKKLWICLLERKKSLELINLASPHCACRHIGSCSCFTPL